jgi:hypothetical protein
MSFLLKIVESGSGREFSLGAFPTLEDCSEELDRLDSDWGALTTVEDITALDDDNPLAHYEGCDAYATDRNGVTYAEEMGDWVREQ